MKCQIMESGEFAVNTIGIQKVSEICTKLKNNTINFYFEFRRISDFNLFLELITI